MMSQMISELITLHRENDADKPKSLKQTAGKQENGGKK